jgi:antitoxin Phd
VEAITMTIDTNAIVTATEANQNFSRVAKLAEKKGRVVVFKNNRPI